MQSKLKQIAREVTRHGLEKSTKTPVLVDSGVLTPPQRQVMSPTMSQKPGRLKSKLCSPVSQANQTVVVDSGQKSVKKSVKFSN